MIRKTWISARAAVRQRWQQWEIAMAAWAWNVRPWKRAAAWIYAAGSTIFFVALATFYGHPLWLLGAVICAGLSLKYLRVTEDIMKRGKK